MGLIPPAAPAGFYTVNVTVPIRTYAAVFRTVDGVDFARLDAETFGGVIGSGELTVALFTDADGDTFTFPVPDPAIPSQTVADCDDNDLTVFPGAVEVPGDGKDNDCNPLTSDEIIVTPGTIGIEATMKGPMKGPLVGLRVHVYDKAAGGCATKSPGGVPPTWPKWCAD